MVDTQTPEPLSKRQRIHPWQRQRLKVPISLDDIQSDVYEDTFWENLGTARRRPRPLPSSQVLGSMTSTNQSPLLQAFYQKIGVAQNEQESDRNTEDVVEETTTEPVEDLENPAMSTLTLAQHRRFLKLTSSDQTNRRTPSERQHLKQLRPLVQAEQEAYRGAVNAFWQKHADTLRLGFSKMPTSSFCRFASLEHQRMNETFGDFPTRFGKHRQLLSLHSPPADQRSLDIPSMNVESIHQDPISESLACTNLPEVGKSVRPLSNAIPSKPFLLKKDARALEFAQKTNAQVLTTDETLETILQSPGDFSCRWMIYATRVSPETTILEIPIAQTFSTPRECLTRGLQEGLHRQATVQPNEEPQCYRYSLWILPSLGNRQSVRVLIRSRIRGSDPANPSRPVRIRPQVEYFGRQELSSVTERALWILDQILFQHQVVTKVCRVDANSCQILSWQETNVAHAFTESSTIHGQSTDPLAPFYSMIQLLQSLPMALTRGNHTQDPSPYWLLCLPSREVSVERGTAHVVATNNPHAVSVHEVATGSEVVAVDLKTTFENANGVLLNAESLRHCQRDWKWDRDDRIPDTFPVHESTPDQPKDSQKKR